MNADEDNRAKTGLARNIARQLIKKAKITSPPILLKEIAKQIPDLDISGTELSDGISGMQATHKGVSFIQYNSLHPVKRNRFTVAHELGHCLLGHTTTCNSLTKNPIESEANDFASELLMPLSLLKTVILRHSSVEDLSRTFWVSKEAMEIRILETGLWKKLTGW